MIADVYAAVSAHTLLSGVGQQLGAEFIDQHAAPPRMVWVPTTDGFRHGKRQTGASSKTPRSTGTRLAGVMVRVWGKASVGSPTAVDELRATEELVRKLLAVVHELGFGDYQVGSIDWVNSAGGELLQYGRCADVHLTFEVPIYKTLAEDGLTTRTIASATHAGDVDFTGVPP